MAKQSGIGDYAFVQGYDLSGDIASLTHIGGGPALLEATGINSSAFERMGGVRSGEISFNAFFNDAALQEHPALSGLPTTDVVVSYLRGAVLGNPAAAMVAKQINYDFARAADGSLLATVQTLSNATFLEWLQQLTAGRVTHASAANGSSIDFGATSTLFGASAYQHVFSMGSGTVVGRIEDSADNSTFAAVTALTFTGAAARTAERLVTATGATIRRYVRFASTGTFTDASLWAAFIRHLTSTL